MLSFNISYLVCGNHSKRGYQVKAEGIGGEREDKFKENFTAIVHFAHNEEKYFSCWVLVG
jgi:hypothetical protein